MGSASEKEHASEETGLLFGELPEYATAKSKVQRVEAPVWTESKARLIADYLQRFTYVTRHGAYIDGFAAPQSREHTATDAAAEACAAKLVLHNRPLRLRKFWLCDVDKKGVAVLEEIKRDSPEMRGRDVVILQGDFNRIVDRILDSGVITESMATFCLVDQRTFECHWDTLQKLAAHKQSGHKIELFYFLGTSWLDRAIGGTKNKGKIDRWWGRSDWSQVLSKTDIQRAEVFANRFANELRYEYVSSWPIYERGANGGRLMYCMIHCSDHPRAPKLMASAYRAVARPPEPKQISIWDFLGKVPSDPCKPTVP